MSYLTVQDYQRLRGYSFSPRKPPLGQRVGVHDSPVQGFNVEFSEYRAYTPGDDVKRLDWKVYGRTNRLVVKRHEHQTTLHVAMLIDASPSMHYRGVERRPLSFRRLRPGSLPPPLPDAERPSKYDHACRLAMALAFVLLQQKDQVAMGVAGDGLHSLSGFHSSFRHLAAMDRLLLEVPRKGFKTACIPESLRALRHHVSRRSLVFVFSDFMEREDEVLQQARMLRAAGNEVVLFHVLHPDELLLPDSGPVLLRDSETGEMLPLSDAGKRNRYRENLQRYLDRLHSACRREGVGLHLVSTDQPFYEAVREYLTKRTVLR